MLASRKRRELGKKLAARVKARYGELKRRKVRPLLDQLVLGILWRHTSVRRATRALRGLQREFVDWNEVRVSQQAEVAGTMSGAEWAGPAAQSVLGVLQSVFETHNTVALEFLRELTNTQARTFLQSLPGIGRDVADEVLLLSLEVEVLPLSEEAARMCYRLGLIPSERATRANQKALAGCWGPELYAGLVMFFSDEAKSTCRHDKAQCSQCLTKSMCAKEGL